MSTHPPPLPLPLRLPSLRSLLLLDAATCAAMGLALLAGAPLLAALTRLPAALLLGAGLALLPIAAFMAAVGLSRSQPAAAVRLVVLGNALWAGASLLLLLGPWLAPNGLGIAFLAAQALVVALLAWLEGRALQRRRTASPVNPAGLPA